MDGTKLFPLFDQARLSRPTAPNPQAINAVAVHYCRLALMYAHETVVLSAVAESIARHSGYRYAGIFDANKHSTANLFFVRRYTPARRGAETRDPLRPPAFGAVVPHPFAKTKAITYQLINALAARPCGWSAFAGMTATTGQYCDTRWLHERSAMLNNRNASFACFKSIAR